MAVPDYLAQTDAWAYLIGLEVDSLAEDLDRHTDLLPTIRVRPSRLLRLASQPKCIAPERNVRCQYFRLGNFQHDLRDSCGIAILVSPVALKLPALGTNRRLIFQ